MKARWIIFFILPFLGSCKNVPGNIEIANNFVDAFYSFDSLRLAEILKNADDSSQLKILYYQKWAECGNYKVLTRHECISKNDSIILCPITVKDDLISALKIDFNTTDTFLLSINKGQITNVQNSSNDPEIYFKAREWVIKNLPELIEGPCKGIWVRGTPCECIKARIKGYAQFIASEKKE